MFPRVLLMSLLCPPLTARAAAESIPPRIPGIFAGSDIAGKTVALAVDDAGRVYLSRTSPAYGQGLPQAAAALPAERRERENRAIFSLGDRSAASLRWLEELKTKPVASSESVTRLEDTDGDGRADKSTVIATGFDGITDGPAGGLTVTGETVFFGGTPSLWRIGGERQGEGEGWPREAMLTGFGIRPAGGLPGIRAMTWGPDGMLYFTTADQGCQVTAREGSRFSLEDTGGVFRCHPDGAELELLATGLRDPAGIVVDSRGRVLVADAGPEPQGSRLLLVLPGADFGWNATNRERGVFVSGGHPSWMLPAAGYCAGRASGLAAGPGGAELLMADGGVTGGIVPVTLRGAGGGCALTISPPLWTGPAVQGLAAAPDGSLLWVSAAGIYRLPADGISTEWKAGAALLAAGVATLPPGDLPALLEHPHPLARRRAREVLTARGYRDSLEVLARVAKRASSLDARLNAMWGLAALARAEPLLINEILPLLPSAEPEIRALAVRILGEIAGDHPPVEILALLRDPAPEVRVEAAVAIGRLRPPGGAEALLAAVRVGDEDPFLRHALTVALSRFMTPQALAAMGRTATAPEVKATAFNALRHLHAAEIASFLADSDPAFAAAAGEAIYDGMLYAGYPALADVLERSDLPEPLLQEAFVRRALGAALRMGTPGGAAAVAAFASLPESRVPPALREAALATLAAWDAPPDEEPVHNRHDPPMPRARGIARPFLLKLQPAGAVSPPSAAALFAAAGKDELNDAERIDALQQLAVLQPAKAAEVCHAVLPGHGTPAVRAAARVTLMKLEPAGSYRVMAEAFAAGSPQEIQAVLQVAARYDSRQADLFWQDLGKRFLDGTIPPDWQVDVLEGLHHRDVVPRGKIRRLLEAEEGNLDEASDSLARWRMCETGGDPDKGQLLYETGRLLNCMECHSLRGRGGSSGPELDGAGARLTRPQLLAALIQPSTAITPGYGRVTLTLQDDGQVTGLLRKRDGTSLLLATSAGSRRFGMEAVKSISAPVSPMPSAAALLTPREVRDLVAWLETLK